MAILSVILMLFLFVFQSTANLIKNDHLCSITGHDLCVREILMAIKNTTDSIRYKAIQPESRIHHDYEGDSDFEANVKEEKDQMLKQPINNSLHIDLFKLPNINIVSCSYLIYIHFLSLL